MTNKAPSFAKFQLDILDCLQCMREQPSIISADDSLAFMSGYLRAAGWEIIAEAMQATLKNQREAEAGARDDRASAARS